MKYLHFYSRLLVMLTLVTSVGLAQAEEPVLTTYKLQQVSSVGAGGKYVFVQNSRAMIGQISNNALQTTDTYGTIGIVGNEDYVWTLETTTDGYYMKNISANKYLKNGSSTNLSLVSDNSQSIWAFSFADDIANIFNTSLENRCLGLTEVGATAYKAYKGINPASHPNSISVYQLVEDTRTITWQSNGETYTTTVPLYGKIQMPTTSPEACFPTVDEFVGWSKKQPTGASWTVAPTLIAEGDPVDNAQEVTYYAVFKSKSANKWYTNCPELYTITYNANGGTGEDQVVYYETKTGVTIYDGAAFSKTDCSLYMWTQNTDGTGVSYKPGATSQSLTNLLNEGKTGTLYAQWTGNLTATGDVHLTSGVGISVYCTAPANNLITIASSEVSLVHHIKVSFKDENGSAVADADCPFTLCNNGTDNFNKVTSITTEGSGSFSQTYSVQYTPTKVNQLDTYILHLEGVDQAGKTVYNSADMTLYGRSLPEKFVLAIKKNSDNKWYAIPNVLGDASDKAVPEAVAIDVDDESAPMAVKIFCPNKDLALYKADVRYKSTEHRGAVRFKSMSNSKYITATTTDNTSFYQPDGNNNNQQFYLTSSDLTKYNITLDPAEYTDNTPSRWISFSGNKIGWFKTSYKDVYILPISDVYERELTSEMLGTICLPFAVEEFSGAEFYKMSYLEKDGSGNPYKINYESVDALEAGKPYIFQPNGTKIVCKQKGDMVSNPIAYDGFYGTFSAIQDGTAGAVGNTLEGNYMVYNNNFAKCGAGCSLSAYRAYVKMDEIPLTPSTAPTRRMMSIGKEGQPEFFDPIPGVITSIDMLGESQPKESQKVMHNSQLFIIRGGKMYNAVGVLIK